MPLSTVDVSILKDETMMLLKQIFTFFDTDNSGDISVEDFNPVENPEVAEEFFKLVPFFDADQDQRIDDGEFVRGFVRRAFGMASRDQTDFTLSLEVNRIVQNLAQEFYNRLTDPGENRGTKRSMETDDDPPSKVRCMDVGDVVNHTDLIIIDPPTTEDLRTAFRYLDADGNGMLTVEDFKNPFTGLVDPEKAKEFFAVAQYFDVDKDGCVNQFEFMRGFQRLASKEPTFLSITPGMTNGQVLEAIHRNANEFITALARDLVNTLRPEESM